LPMIDPLTPANLKSTFAANFSPKDFV